MNTNLLATRAAFSELAKRCPSTTHRKVSYSNTFFVDMRVVLKSGFMESVDSTLQRRGQCPYEVVGNAFCGWVPSPNVLRSNLESS